MPMGSMFYSALARHDIHRHRQSHPTTVGSKPRTTWCASLPAFQAQTTRSDTKELRPCPSSPPLLDGCARDLGGHSISEVQQRRVHSCHVNSQSRAVYLHARWERCGRAWQLTIKRPPLKSVEAALEARLRRSI